jgi:hypothetical protein
MKVLRESLLSVFGNLASVLTWRTRLRSRDKVPFAAIEERVHRIFKDGVAVRDSKGARGRQKVVLDVYEQQRGM